MLNTSSLLLVCIVIATVLSVTGFAPNTMTSSSAVSLSQKQRFQRIASADISSSRCYAGPLDSLLDAIGNIGGQTAETNKQDDEPPPPDVVIRPDYRLAVIFLSAGIILDTIPYVQLVLGPLITVLGILFLVQTFRIRFTLDKDAFELRQGSTLDDTGDNIIVGGANRWSYDSFVNYDFFPRGWIDLPQGPILVYFKETQTPSDKWNDGPGASANSPEAIANGAIPGQVHFFPALCDTKQLRDEFEKRNVAKIL